MIKRCDVLRVKMPFPDMSSNLALNSHMYICREKVGNTVKLVKCQTLKPYMLINSPMRHYWDELPDINRNPFQKTTRVDCDREFVTYNVYYENRMKTTIRPDVSVDVVENVERELFMEGYDVCEINEAELISLNNWARWTV